MDALTAKCNKLNEQLVAVAQAGPKAAAEAKGASEALAEASRQLEAKTNRWFELAELAGEL